MRKTIWILALGGLLSLPAGCSNQTGATATGQSSPAIAPSPVANVPPDPTLASANAPLRVPSAPVVEENSKALPEGTLPESLISKTDPLRRLPQVRVGRSNPFGSLTVSPRVVTTATVASPVAVPQAPQVLPSLGTLATAPVNLPLPLRSSPNGPLPSIPVPPTGTVRPSAPVPLAASLARQIRISGAMQVGDRLSIIVEVPNEHTSRPVTVGDYIGNGSVLVKRIEMRGNQEPRVIFEENGVEVVREVGDVSPLFSTL